ncbi:TlyA family RNA methyltransferase [Kytococcus sedentarius]|uniref:TlyA family RNA methyltransferase n=1 Tax=Kytococcus sedentarius TaxID=1276 RepID=UPI0035BBBF63
MRLDKAVVERGLARSRTRAQQLIDAGQVLVDGEVSRKGSHAVDPASVTLAPEAGGVSDEVSRAQRKLERALELWPGVTHGVEEAVDVGASTGGFTQVLLRAGVSCVWAVDVGHDQLVDSLRRDERVVVREGVNARDTNALEAAGLTEGGVGLVVCDVSFISLRHILPSIRWLLGAGGHAVVLCKPQFEVGPQGSQRGVVRSPQTRRQAVVEVLSAAGAAGLVPRSLAVSGTPGTHGNVEFLLHLELPAADGGGAPLAGDGREVVGAAWHSELPDVSNSFWDGEESDAYDL